DLSAPGAQRSWKPSTALVPLPPEGSPCTANAYVVCRSPARSATVSAWRPRNARAKDCCSMNPCTATSPCPHSRASLAAVFLTSTPSARQHANRSQPCTSHRMTLIARSAPSPGETSKKPCWPAGSCTAVTCSCWTSPPAASTWAPEQRSTTGSAGSSTKEPPSWWSPVRSKKSWGWLTTFWWSPRVPSGTRGPPTNWTSIACSTSSWKDLYMSEQQPAVPEQGKVGTQAMSAGLEAPGSQPPGGKQGLWTRLSSGTGLRRNLGLVVALLLLCGVGALTAGDRFVDANNALTIMRAAAVIGVVSIGATFVITAGGIDLSVGSVLGLATVWASTLATQAMAEQYHWIIMVFAAVA